MGYCFGFYFCYVSVYGFVGVVCLECLDGCFFDFAGEYYFGVVS